jgi:hypothetical protein
MSARDAAKAKTKVAVKADTSKASGLTAAIEEAEAAGPLKAEPRSLLDIDPLLGKKRKGGRVDKTGVYRLHKGEYVVTAAKARKAGRRTKRGAGRR